MGVLSQGEGENGQEAVSTLTCLCRTTAAMPAPRCLPPLLLLCFAAPALAQPLLPVAPLPYVQQLAPLEGKTLILKSATCTAPGKPVTQGRLYLEQKGTRVSVVRVEYNAQGKAILDSARGTPNYRYFDRYVTRREAFNWPVFNGLLGVWRAFGMTFRLGEVKYACQVN